MQHGKWTVFLLTSIRGLHYGCPENSWLCRAELRQFQAPRTSFPGPTALQMGRQPPDKLTGLRNRGAGQKGCGELFSPLSVWLLMHAACRAGKVTDQPSLPSFPLLFVSVGKIKKVWGGGRLGTFYFDTISSYKKLQKYTKIFYILPVCNSVSFFPLSLSAIPQEFSRNVWKDYVWIHDDMRFLPTEYIS